MSLSMILKIFLFFEPGDSYEKDSDNQTRCIQKKMFVFITFFLTKILIRLFLTPGEYFLE